MDYRVVNSVCVEFQCSCGAYLDVAAHTWTGPYEITDDPFPDSACGSTWNKCNICGAEWLTNYDVYIKPYQKSTGVD